MVEIENFIIQKGEDVISGYSSPEVYEARCGDSGTYQKRVAVDRSFLFNDFAEVIDFILQDDNFQKV